MPLENAGPGKTNPYVFFADGEAPGAPGLAATKCEACGRHSLGKVPVCGHCFSRKVQTVAAGQKGVLAEFAVVHHSAGGFKAPYAIGSIKTSEGITLMAPMEGDVTKLKAGMALKFMTVPRENGAMLGFAYAPA